MLSDTAMRFVGQRGADPAEVLEMVEHLSGRFLAPTHHLILELKVRFVRMLLERGEYGGGGLGRKIYCRSDNQSKFCY